MKFFVPFLMSVTMVMLLVPLIRKMALHWRFVDKPSQRKIHEKPIPLMGGLAVYIGCILPMLIINGWSPLSSTVAIGGTVLLITGLTDDWFKSRGREFPVWPRLCVYVVTAILPLAFGIKVIGITNLADHGMILFPAWLAGIATILWVFGLTNMINFIDGVDGLASGIVAISSITLLIESLLRHQDEITVLAALLAGSCLAFLMFNFYPAKIFLGDAGAVFLGFTLSVMAIEGAFKSATFVSIFIPVLALGVPIIDTVFVFSRRFLHRTGLHKADKLHTHHSLMKWGLSQTQTVSFLYLVGLLFSLLSIILMLVFRT